ncbi:MAG TPA: PLP-dependent aminotransferase family protein [Minicystis sp.]|nr:PLP-dependent aminotransferase family protein [Minicystis sp.]
MKARIARKMSMAEMGTDWVAAEPSKRHAVKAYVSDLVASGALRRGSRVPSILELSRTLAVAKNTVIGALDELCGEGVLEARERQGFFVRSVRRREPARATRLADLEIDRVAHGMASILVQSGEDFVPIGSGTAAESLLATPAWSATLKNAPPRDPLKWLRYADPMGEPHLREAIAARYGATDEPASRVLITFGAVEALNLTFAATAAETRSRRIAIESPGYFMLEPLLERLGLEPVPVPRSQDGLDLDRLRREIKKAKIAAVMVNPNHHNPVGSSLALAERFELAKLADEKRFWIVEDDVYRGLWTEEEEPPTIHSLLPQRTLFVSSFSKTLGPALRIGFVIAPDALVGDLRRRKFTWSLSGDAYTQNLVAEFVDRRGHQRHLAEMRDELARRARIARVQAEPFATLGRFAGPFRGGLFWRFAFSDRVDAMALYKLAREKNVLVSPGCFFQNDPSASRAADAWMRVNVSRCEGGTLTKALSMLLAMAKG